MRRGRLSEESLPKVKGLGKGEDPSARSHDPIASGAVEQLRTEFRFTLPRGYTDSEGKLHREGVMRLATARDELVPLADMRVRENPAYLSVVLIGRLITSLGTLKVVDADVVEHFFAADLAYLQRFYEKINSDGTSVASTVCPHCSQEFDVDMGSRLGE